ncbi:hypothetical protein ACHAP5_008029 [Fusarium lateritium]
MAQSIYTSRATSNALSYIEALLTASMSSPRPFLSDDNINVAHSTLVDPRPPQQAIALHNTLKSSLGSDTRIPRGIIASCNWQLDNCEAITLGNMNFMLGMLGDSFPESLHIQPAAYLETLHLSITKFLSIIPILDTVDEGQWSLIHVFYQPGNKEKHIPQRVEVQYYDPSRAPGRSNMVRKQVASWIEHAYGEHVRFRFIDAKGPVDKDNPNMSGIHVMMAAREFAHYGSVTTESSSWGCDAKDILGVKLQQQGRQLPHLPPVNKYLERKESSLFLSPTSDHSGERQDPSSSVSPTTAATTPATSPVVSQRKRPHGGTIPGNINKTAKSGQLAAKDGCNNPEALSRPQNGQYKTISPKTASKDSTTAAICNIVAARTNGYDDEPCSEPNSKRRRVEKDNLLSFNVTKKMAEIALFVQDLGLPAVDALQRKREELYAELADREKTSKKMEEEMWICDDEFEQRKKEHRSFGQECETAETEIKMGRDQINGIIPKLPKLSSLDIPGVATDMDISQAFSDAMEATVMIPLQKKLTDNLSRKRKASEMLEFAWQVCEKRQNEFENAGNEERLAEIKSREACKREELAAITESFVMKTRACNKAWETVEGRENKDWYGAFCRRRAQI